MAVHGGHPRRRSGPIRILSGDLESACLPLTKMRLGDLSAPDNPDFHVLPEVNGGRPKRNGYFACFVKSLNFMTFGGLPRRRAPLRKKWHGHLARDVRTSSAG